jgi:serine/threonine-protein kinase HipA
MPRHFEQSAARARLPNLLVTQTTELLPADLPAALDEVENSWPRSVPEQLFQSIATGARARLESLRQ